MDETRWTITARDGATIHGRRNATREKTDSCVVMVHGLTGNMQEYQHKAGAVFFAVQGFDVFRFDLYGEEDGARRLRDCTLPTHAADLQDVLAAKAAGYKKIFLIGHSYGGPTIMLAQPQQATAISLWDPSFDLPRLWSMMPAFQENGYCIEGRGLEVLMNPAMQTEIHLYDRENCLALARTIDARSRWCMPNTVSTTPLMKCRGTAPDTRTMSANWSWGPIIVSSRVIRCRICWGTACAGSENTPNHPCQRDDKPPMDRPCKILNLSKISLPTSTA